MATKIFRVRLFEVDDENPDWGIQPTFAESLRRACALPRERRVKTITYKPRRLEDHDVTHDGCVLLNFTTLTYDGPSLVSGQGPLQPFPLNQTDRFGHETAALYDPHRKLLLVESTQSGVKAGTIAQFATHFSGTSAAYPLLPCLKPDAAARLREIRQFRRLEMRASLGPMGREDRARCADVTTAVGHQFGAGIVDIKVAVAPYRPGSLDRDSVLGFIRRAMGGRLDGDVTKLKVSAKEHDDTKAEVIDLFGDQISFESELLIDDTERKIMRANRWNELRAMRREHLRDDPRP